MSEEQETTTINYREEVLRLVNEGKIKHTTKYVEKATDETLEKIYRNYLTKQLDETNEHVADTLIRQISELITQLDFVDVNDTESLGDSDLFKRDVKNVLSYVTPYIPFVGLICGGICITKYVIRKKTEEKSAEEPKEEV